MIIRRTRSAGWPGRHRPADLLALTRRRRRDTERCRQALQFVVERGAEPTLARRAARDVAEDGLDPAAGGRRRWPIRRRGRARGAAARSSRAFASGPACTPRSGIPIPRAARTADDPRRPDRTAPAAGRHRRSTPSRDSRRPASTNHAVDARVREAMIGALHRAVEMARPLRDGVAQPLDEPVEARRRERRVLVDDHVDERVERARRAAASRAGGVVLVRGVDADARVAPHHAQQPAVVHLVEQMGGRARRAAPVVGHGAELEMLVHLAWVHFAAVARSPAAISRDARAPPSTASDRRAGASAPRRRRTRSRS